MRNSELHSVFLEVAETLGGGLHAALEAGGPLPERGGEKTPFMPYLARAVAGQQLSVKAARSIWQRVEAECGELSLLDALRSDRALALKACGLSGAKVKTLIAIADAAREGRLDEQALKAMTVDERVSRLTEIWGVGQWTADMANMFWFDEPDIWPDGDVAARKTLEKLTSKRRKTVRTAKRFAPYRSFLALYMWRHVDAPPTD